MFRCHAIWCSSFPLVGRQMRRCRSLICAEGCNSKHLKPGIGKPPTSYRGVCRALAALVPFNMTTAAVKAAVGRIKVCFFMTPVFGVGALPFEQDSWRE